MKLLLDTHVLLWWFADPSRIATSVRARLRNRRNAVHGSVVAGYPVRTLRP